MEKRSDSEPPSIVKNIIWITQNWRIHWLSITISSLFFISIFIYQNRNIFFDEAHAIEQFPISIADMTQTENFINIQNDIRFDILTPYRDGGNRYILSGIIRINGKNIDNPKKRIFYTFQAKILNETKFTKLYSEGDNLIRIYLEVEGIRYYASDANFNYTSLKSGILLVISAKNSEKISQNLQNIEQIHKCRYQRKSGEIYEAPC